MIRMGNKMIEHTLAIIKPDAMAAGHAKDIISHIKKHGFTIVEQETMHLSKRDAQAFYAEHKDRGFFGELVEFMISGPVTVMVLEKENAIADWRKLMGATNPAEAEEGTIRKLFGASKGENATHGSDSAAAAEREIDFFFAEPEEQSCCSH